AGRYHSNMRKNQTLAGALSSPAQRARLMSPRPPGGLGRRSLAALLALTIALPAWPQQRLLLNDPTRTAAAAAAAPERDSRDGGDQVYDNLNRSVKAGQKSDFGLRSNNTVVET